jgi:tetratricopeptide (TPR) repeat protein
VGTVNGNDGKPIGDGVVELYGGQAAPVLIHTSLDGSFRFENVSIGAHQLVARWNLNETSEQVSIMPGVNNVNIVLPIKSHAEGGTISVTQLATPKNVQHQLKKAELALSRNKWGEAAEFVERALTESPQCAEALALRAVIEHQQHTLQLAAEDAEKAIEYDPNYPPAYFILGSVYNDLNRSEDAIRTLAHGIEIGPDLWQGYYEMGRALLLKKDFPAALRQLEKASSLAPPGFASLHLAKGYAVCELKHPTECRRELDTFIRMRPNSDGANRARMMLGQLAASTNEDPINSHQPVPHLMSDSDSAPVPKQ